MVKRNLFYLIFTETEKDFSSCVFLTDTGLTHLETVEFYSFSQGI